MKAKIMRISAEAIFDLLRPGIHAYKSENPELPADARITGIWATYDYSREIMLRIESESFDHVEEGMKLEIMEPPRFKRMNHLEAVLDFARNLEEKNIYWVAEERNLK